jgi:hypothetical protein
LVWFHKKRYWKISIYDNFTFFVHISEYLNSVSRITWTLFVRIFSEF